MRNYLTQSLAAVTLQFSVEVHPAEVVSHTHPELNEGGEIVYHVVEGDITKLTIKFEDKLGNICQGNTNLGVINRVMPKEVEVGNPYNGGSLERAFGKLNSHNLFSNMCPGVDYQTPIWVDRAGIKDTIAEIQETNDERGQIASRGHRELANGEVRGDGPPTTLSGTGIDRMAFLQANLTRDNTKFVNRAIVGARDIFQVDQGVGIGSKNAFFNRHKISATRFIPLKKVKKGKGKVGPPSLVLHGP
ncbi:hypothetical protein BUALT_Bualt08G0033200 [Buddleja alternifolia]|uniref:Uncharacterized protein n=1 Tax=Buddleja alternifolia TaxID=168488 RepID=A0AAV6X2P2_9LAMI|nr:hypothetical protein BUALT_Bualt08G0033200 [Buddleja alternifolia]